jgi:hypothetical protein
MIHEFADHAPLLSGEFRCLESLLKGPEGITPAACFCIRLAKIGKARAEGFASFPDGAHESVQGIDLFLARTGRISRAGKQEE